jgi:hypothetical protein
MSFAHFINHHKSRISMLSDQDLKITFKTYKTLQARSVNDEIITELLAQRLDNREAELEEIESSK